MSRPVPSGRRTGLSRPGVPPRDTPLIYTSAADDTNYVIYEKYGDAEKQNVVAGSRGCTSSQ